MTSRTRSILIAVAIAVAVGVAEGTAGVAIFSAEHDYQAASKAHDEAKVALTELTEADEKLDTDITAAEQELRTLQAVLAERKKFSAQLERVRQGAASAVGKVETAPWLNRIAALQDAVVKITDDPAQVAALTEKVAHEGEGIERVVAEHTDPEEVAHETHPPEDKASR